VAFLRIFIDFIPDYFEPGEVDEIWITFPDPYPKEPKQNKRLTSPFFLEQYRAILKPGGIMHLKTDAVSLYKFTKKVLLADPEAHIRHDIADLYQQPEIPELLQIQTTYEKKHLAEGRKIYYLQFTIN
jgi:tRNA (guanine-N7-)-methyltransferase